MPGTKTWASGDTLTAADMNAYARGGLVMAYASVTTAESFTTLADATGLSLTFTAIAGRLYKISLHGLLRSSVTTDVAQLLIADGANNTISVGQVLCVDASFAVTCSCFALVSPSAGSVTYKARFVRSSGSGTCTLDAAATYPAYIIAEDVGVA